MAATGPGLAWEMPSTGPATLSRLTFLFAFPHHRFIAMGDSSQLICHHKILTRGRAYCSVNLIWEALCDQGRLGNLPALCSTEQAEVLIFTSPAHFDSAKWRNSKHDVSVMTERTETRYRLAKLSTFKGEIFIFYILNSPRGLHNMFSISLVFENLSYMKSKAAFSSCGLKW